MSNRRKLTDREMKATALNKKEERVLQKTFGTLNLEMSFTYNVLSLRVRTVKANFKRLRDRVDKLKSNLSAEEIKALRQLEEEGKFKPTSTFSVNAAMKIAAAARRLNLYPEGIKRSRTSLSPKRAKTNDKLLPSRSNTDTNLLRKRSNSVTGVFIDAPVETPRERRSSIETANPTLGVQSVVRSVSAVPPSVTQPNNELKITQSSSEIRPATSQETNREKQTVSKLHKPGTPQTKSSQTRATTPDISMADIFNRGDYVPEKGKTRSPRDKMSMMVVADESLDTGRTKLFEDRRQEMIQDEQTFLKGLEKRKKGFITDVDLYLQLNPPAKFDTPYTAADRPGFEVNAKSETEDDEEVMKYTRRRRQIRRYDSDRTFTNEADYKKREGELWKDMNKTRYLRVSDDKLDLSGMVTLAKDQMKLFKILQYQEPSHIVTH